MQKDLRSREKEIHSLFASARKMIRRVASGDGLNKEESREFEGDLHVWFHGFARRPGNEVRSAETLRAPLLLAASRYVSSYRGKQVTSDPTPPPEEKSQESPLAKEPPEPEKEH